MSTSTAADPSSEMEALLARGGADGSLTLHRSAWSADILKDAALAVADLEDEEEARGVCGSRARCGRAGERGRQAGLLRFPVRLGCQPFAGGDRHLDGRRRADPGPGDPAQDRDAAAPLRRLLGRFRQAHARTGDAAPAAGHGATCVLGALLRSGIPGPDAGRLRRHRRYGAGAHRRADGRKGRACDPRRSGSRGCRTADAEGDAGPAIRGRDPLRRSGLGRCARTRPPRGKAHDGRQAGRARLLRSRRHQRPDDAPCSSGQAGGAAQIRRSDDLRTGGRGDRASGEGRHPRRCGARHHRRHCPRLGPRHVAHPSRYGAIRPVRDRMRQDRAASERSRLAGPFRSEHHHDLLHGRRHGGRHRRASHRSRKFSDPACRDGVGCLPRRRALGRFHRGSRLGERAARSVEAGHHRRGAGFRTCRPCGWPCASSRLRG